MSRNAESSTECTEPLNDDWWRNAVIYQVYPRSYADADGDGTGDLNGVRSRLPYLQELGVDAIWLTPWYQSPLADGGYDVADYRVIDPTFGTLEDAEHLISEAAEIGIRTIIDVVPNHISDQHRWFQEALDSPPGSPERSRFWFHPGKGPGGDELPNDWQSSFGGDTWTRTTNPDGSPGEWYLHLFSAHQPDLNWNNPDVWEEHEAVLRFWFDRGVAGIRIDSAAMPIKHPDLPPIPESPAPGEHPHLDRDEIHDIYRAWRKVADSYPDTRVLVGEVWLDNAERFAAYLRPDEMHSAFNFDFMARPWDAAELRTSITNTLRDHALVDAPPTWVLSNHDVTRPVTRYGREDSGFAFEAKRFGVPTDRKLGEQRARAAALLTAALPGTLYIYQGDELGLPEVDVPVEAIQDPMYLRSGKVNPGRDGCRVPIPWSGTAPPYGFSEGRAADIWLPQPRDWAGLTVEAQSENPSSMLSLYRQAISLRRSIPELRGDDFAWLDTHTEVIGFVRGRRFASITNFGRPIPLPPHERVLLASTPLTDAGEIPQDSTVWLLIQ
ncbi:alpha-amylase family glycosyl hydrolase [Populibacterium corticicola]|uniref:Alpha-amylase family glycosyl hydrolase n=1 Tax=Populibacterium corticicola TaxID=1812826 RepID=A0ABW5XGY0_9MICO